MALIHILCNHDSQPSYIDRALSFQFTIKLYRRHIFRLCNDKEFRTPPQLVRVHEIRSPAFDLFCPICESELSDILMNWYDFLEEAIGYNMQIIISLVEEIKIFDKDKDPINKVYNYSIDYVFVKKL